MKSSLRVFVYLLSLVLAGSALAQDLESAARPSPVSAGSPVEHTMQRAGSTQIDLRSMPERPRREFEKPERPEPPRNPVELPGAPTAPQAPSISPERNVPAPPPSLDFDGLDRENWGSGSPPDPVGDAGPEHYIQAVNSSVGIYDKTDGSQIAAFTFDTLMAQGSFGNQCDDQNFGDPIVLYDTFEDRWVLTDFAFTLDGGGNVNPPEAFQCFAVSQTSDPVAGGWYFYSIRMDDFLNDYPKLGVWTDGIYMSANMFGFPAAGTFQTTRVWAFNKAQMYAGAPTVQVVTFDPGIGDFTLLPSNARLQTGTPPPGTPNYFVSTWNFLNALTVYKFDVDWERPSLSTFTGPDTPLAATSWPNAAVANAPQPGTAQLIDVLQIRAMMQNQYTNMGGVESLWATHTVRRANTAGFAAPRWYQVDVTGGTVAANLPQAATWDPDGANVIHRFMPSLALDRAGNLALGYSTSNNTAPNFPSIKYAGRLSTDPVNTFSLTEQVMFTGTASQTTSARWGDYTSMTLDPDGCTFWYTNEYANPLSQAANMRWKTRIGRFKFDECTPVGAGGTLEGTVTESPGGDPISGATISFGSRSTTTDINGDYSFTGVPAGTYPSVTASAPGYNSSTATSIVIADAATTDQDFALTAAPTSGCMTDTTQADFQTGLPDDVDLNTSPDEVILLDAPAVDQQNTTLGTSGVGITITTWGGQTFTPSVTGQLVQVDINLFCAGCTGTIPNLTLSIRATTGGLPTGADLAAATIPGFNSGAATFYTATFGTPPTLNAGTQYAIVIRPTANPAPGTYALTRSGTAAAGANVYPGGTRVSGATSGTVWSIPLTGGVSTDAGFRAYMQTGFPASGELESGLKDANPPVGYTPTWTTISWNATTPADTAVSFQVAASNSATGPFSFVGPDGTAGTFYTTSGGSLSQFDGNRYLKYKAYLSSTNSAATPTLEDVTVCFENEAPPAPDLTIAKSDGGASVAPGGTVSYTLTYSNTSATGATGVVLTDTVPANTTFNAGASTAGWVCAPDDNAGSTCTLAIGAVAGSSGDLTATFAVTVVNPVAAGVSQISNTASIADDGTNGTDPTPGNNSANDTTPVDAAPDLTIAKSDGGAMVIPGGTVAYTLTYSNVGNQGASGVVLTDTVPASSTFDAGASTAGWVCVPDDNAGSTCTLAVGALAAGSGDQVATFAVTADNPRPEGVTQLSNTASIADDGTNGTDPTPGNNSANDTTPYAPGTDYYTVTPCRLLDTRLASGPISSETEMPVAVSGNCGIPADEVTAIALNFTAINPSGDGFAVLYPDAGNRPVAAVITFQGGQVRTNNAIVSLASDGSIQVWFLIGGNGTSHFTIDLVGYFR